MVRVVASYLTFYSVLNTVCCRSVVQLLGSDGEVWEIDLKMFQDEVGDATKVVFPMSFVVDIDGSVLVSPTYCNNFDFTCS